MVYFMENPIEMDDLVASPFVETPVRLRNPPRVPAEIVVGVYAGPCRDQLLDQGKVAFPSGQMQRRIASGARSLVPRDLQLQVPIHPESIQLNTSHQKSISTNIHELKPINRTRPLRPASSTSSEPR